MARKSREELYQAKRDEFNAKLQAERTANRRQVRQQEAKQNAIVGRIIRERVESGRWPRERFDAMLDEDLVKPHERKLFELEPQDEDGQTTAEGVEDVSS